MARSGVRALSESRIRRVANAAMGRDDVLAFWFGEPDRVTPAFVREAAKAALDDGDTFYGPNLGLPALREAIAGYASRLHLPVAADRVAVTSSGVSALMLAAQALLSPGDRVVAVVPLWPNLVEIPRVLGARVDTVALALDPADGRWHLDLDRLLAALTPDTRAVFVNSPNNPTGWTMDAGQQCALLAHCRRHGIWILSDEAYERLVFDGAPAPVVPPALPAGPGTAAGAPARTPSQGPVRRPRCAPSLLDVADADDRLLVANTFSKTWQMTGWRLGWLVAPPTLVDDLGKLIEFNTSCAPGFVQRAGVAAIDDGEPAVESFVASLAAGRDALLPALAKLPGIEAGIPDGAMYAFFRVDGEPDSVALAERLVREAGLGLAPGAAFGPEGEGWLRWCFARPPEVLAEGVHRFAGALRRR